MSTRRSPLSKLLPARSSRREGCFLAFFIPPFTVLALGLIAVIAAGGLDRPTPAPAAINNFGAAPQVSGVIAPFFMPAVQYWSGSIQSWAGQWQLAPNLVATVMQIESCGDPLAASKAGASGLFQVMPFHFKTNEISTDAETNARRGLSYLKRCWDAAGEDTSQALACYNGGASLLGQDNIAWPDETNRYVYWGTGIYQEAVQGAPRSIFLEQWLANGGSRLCQQANQRMNIKP
jgi:soluble lytic murein transglycosylase-like protein